MLLITEFSEQSRLILYSFANTAYAPHGDGNVYSSTTTDPAIRNTAYAPHGDGNAFAFCGKSVSAVNTAYAPHGVGNNFAGVVQLHHSPIPPMPLTGTATAS